MTSGLRNFSKAAAQDLHTAVGDVSYVRRRQGVAHLGQQYASESSLEDNQGIRCHRLAVHSTDRIVRHACAPMLPRDAL